MRAISVDGGIAYVVDPEKVILRRIEVEDNRFAGLSASSFEAIGSAFWEILAQPIPRFMRFYKGLNWFFRILLLCTRFSS